MASGESFLFGTGIRCNHLNLKWLKEEWAVYCMVWLLNFQMFKNTQACHFSFLEGDYKTILPCLQYWPSKLLVYALFGVTDKSLTPHWQQLSILMVRGQSNSAFASWQSTTETNSGSAILQSELAEGTPHGLQTLINLTGFSTRASLAKPHMLSDYFVSLKQIIYMQC